MGREREQRQTRAHEQTESQRQMPTSSCLDGDIECDLHRFNDTLQAQGEATSGTKRAFHAGREGGGEPDEWAEHADTRAKKNADNRAGNFQHSRKKNAAERMVVRRTSQSIQRTTMPSHRRSLAEHGGYTILNPRVFDFMTLPLPLPQSTATESTTRTTEGATDTEEGKLGGASERNPIDEKQATEKRRVDSGRPKPPPQIPKSALILTTYFRLRHLLTCDVE